MVSTRVTGKHVCMVLLAATSIRLIFFFVNQRTMTRDHSFSLALFLQNKITVGSEQTWNDWIYNSDPRPHTKYDDFEDKYFKRVLDAFKGKPWHDVKKQHFRFDNIPTFFLYREPGVETNMWVQQMRHISTGECPLPCRFTEDRKLISKMDALVLCLKDIKDIKSLEAEFPTRDPRQPWIMFSYEAPPYANMDHVSSDFDNFFNRTMTYRKDADIIISHGFIVNKRDALLLPYHWRIPPYNISTSNSSGMSVKIASLISNCEDLSGRIDYINELKKYIEVDMYGKCGNLTCGASLYVQHAYKPDTEPCLKQIGRAYMFYLAFENCICKGYGSQRIYNLLYHPVVPIVLGGVDYDEILPPHSFINAANYTPSELATYVAFLIDNPEEYNKYFEWRQNLVPSTIGGERILCDLCTRLYDPTLYRYNVITNFSKWFDLDANCQRRWRPSNMSVY